MRKQTLDFIRKDILPTLYPSQMDIVFSENCNQNCDYCWVNKQSLKILGLDSAKKGVDIFLDLPLEEKTITFTASEPLLYPDLYKDSMDYILRKVDGSGDRVNLITTTNGINLTAGIRDYIIDKLGSQRYFRLNISIDGTRQSHDAHRKLRRSPGKSAFSASWKNFMLLPKEKVRVIFTVTPGEVGRFRENIGFILDNGFRSVDIFPQVFTIWKEKELAELEDSLGQLIGYANAEFDEDYDLRLLNRLWGSTHYNKLLLNSKGEFYLYEWILVLPTAAREEYIIGDVKNGLDLQRRLLIFAGLFAEAAGTSARKCAGCSYGNICSLPLPLFLWCRYSRKDFNSHFENFCRSAKIFIKYSKRLNENNRNFLDTGKINGLCRQ